MPGRPELACYSGAAAPSAANRACDVEGVNGKVIEGSPDPFRIPRAVAAVQRSDARTPVTLRFDQFRRLRCASRWRAAEPRRHPRPGRRAAVWPSRCAFTVSPPGGPHARLPRGALGPVLFEPVDDKGTLRAGFVPRPATETLTIGPRTAEVLVAQNAATPEQVRRAWPKQPGAALRKLGDIPGGGPDHHPEELTAAIGARRACRWCASARRSPRSASSTRPSSRRRCFSSAATAACRWAIACAQGAVSPCRPADRAGARWATRGRRGGIPRDMEGGGRLPYTVATRVPALPLIVRSGRLVVAMEDPTNRSAIDEIEFAAQCKVVRCWRAPRARRRIARPTKIASRRRTPTAKGIGRLEFEPGDASKAAGVD